MTNGMKVLFLDAHEPGAPADDGISGLAAICQELGVEIVRYSNQYWRSFSRIEDFALRFKEDIERATLVISLGSFHWLKFFNSELGVNSFLRCAIKEGKPFIFQSVRGWEKHFSQLGKQPGSDAVQALYRLIGVTPTEMKVFTNDTPSVVGGGAVAYFRAGDNCFLNADVLGASDCILLTQANILGYDNGVYPVVETGPLHRLIDAGDWNTSLEVGLRPAVFVEVRNAQMKGFVIGGSFLRDGYDAAGGYVPGIENNLMAVRALLTKATSWVSKRQTFESKLYQDLYDLERGLGDILIARLPDYEIVLLRDAELRGIIDKVKENWTKVSDLFDYNDVAEFSRATSAIPAGARRYLSHPIRLNFEPQALGDAAVSQLSTAAATVRRARARLKT